jgi:hypothetical protein
MRFFEFGNLSRRAEIHLGVKLIQTKMAAKPFCNISDALTRR